MQEGQVVCYESQKMNEHKKDYSTHDLVLEETIYALKMWTHYILGKRFVLMSDHSRLRYLFYQQNLNARKYRWLAVISEFYFEIRYIKGKENRVADDLRKRVQVNHIETMSFYGTNLDVRISQAGQQDDKYRDLIHMLQHGIGN